MIIARPLVKIWALFIQPQLVSHGFLLKAKKKLHRRHC
jgi:hypothetical protein